MTPSYRIAVADDEPVMREYFGELLPELGHELVAAVETGRALVRACARLDPDLVITDIRMPDMDGIEASRQISERRPVPIVLVSAFSDDELVERAARTTVLAYLIKPVRKAHLAAAIAIAGTRFEELQALRTETGDLRTALEERRLIERAKGILGRRLGVEEAEAFSRLRSTAMKRRQSLAEIARAIIQSDSITP